MKFIEHKEIDRMRFPESHRQWFSESGLWLVSLDQMLFGIRCNVSRGFERDGKIFWQGIELPYCLGLNRLAILLVPAAVMKAMEQIPEDAGPIAVGHFPVQHRKPMHNDPECWAELCRMVDMPPIDLTIYADENDRLQNTVEAEVFKALAYQR